MFVLRITGNISKLLETVFSVTYCQAKYLNTMFFQLLSGKLWMNSTPRFTSTNNEQYFFRVAPQYNILFENSINGNKTSPECFMSGLVPVTTEENYHKINSLEENNCNIASCRSGQDDQTLCCDWLPKRTRWDCLSNSCPFLSLRALTRKK